MYAVHNVYTVKPLGHHYCSIRTPTHYSELNLYTSYVIMYRALKPVIQK